MKQSLDIKITPFNLIKFALPTVIAQIFMGIYSMVDGIFVSNVIGTDALSAVNIVMPYVMIVLAFGVFVGSTIMNYREYREIPSIYESRPSPWYYYGALNSFLLFAAVVVICVIIKIIIRKHDDKR